MYRLGCKYVVLIHLDCSFHNKPNVFIELNNEVMIAKCEILVSI